MKSLIWLIMLLVSVSVGYALEFDDWCSVHESPNCPSHPIHISQQAVFHHSDHHGGANYKWILDFDGECRLGQKIVVKHFWKDGKDFFSRVYTQKVSCLMENIS